MSYHDKYCTEEWYVGEWLGCADKWLHQVDSGNEATRVECLIISGSWGEVEVVVQGRGRSERAKGGAVVFFRRVRRPARNRCCARTARGGESVARYKSGDAPPLGSKTARASGGVLVRFGFFSFLCFNFSLFFSLVLCVVCILTLSPCLSCLGPSPPRRPPPAPPREHASLSYGQEMEGLPLAVRGHRSRWRRGGDRRGRGCAGAHDGALLGPVQPYCRRHRPQPAPAVPAAFGHRSCLRPV